MKRIIEKRTRYYIAVEGEGERSFIKWLQDISDILKLHIHLDCLILNGGGYKTMLEDAIRHRKKRERTSAKLSIILVDKDRGILGDDGWTIEKLQENSKKNKFNLCLQVPNQEGLLLKLFPNKEKVKPPLKEAHKLLLKVWPEYKKPINAQILSMKFTLNDLKRVAQYDEELEKLLKMIKIIQ